MENLIIDGVIQKEITKCLGNSPLPDQVVSDRLQSLEVKRNQYVSGSINSQIKESLNLMSDPEVQATHHTISPADILAINQKIESLTNWLSTFQLKQRAKNSLVESLDVKV